MTQPGQLDADRLPRLREAQGIAHHVLDGAAHQLGLAQQEPGLSLRLAKRDLHSGLLGLEPGILEQGLHQCQQIVVALLQTMALLGAGEGQQLPYHPVHPLRLEPDPRQGVVRLVRALLRQAYGHLDTRQRGAQLVGDVVEQLLPAIHQLLQPLHHEVKVPRHLGQLIPAPAQGGQQPYPELAPGHLAEAAAQGVHRPGQVPGKQYAEQQAPQAANPEHGGRNVEPGEGTGLWPSGEPVRIGAGTQQVAVPIRRRDGARQNGGGPGRQRLAPRIEGGYLQPYPGRHGLHQGRHGRHASLGQHGRRHLQMLTRQLLGEALFRALALCAKAKPEQLADHHYGQPEAQQYLPEQSPLEDHSILYPMLRTVSMVMASPTLCCNFCRRLQMCTSTLRS
ncbi:hypothetical protein D3C80_844080 [compost metagenome]